MFNASIPPIKPGDPIRASWLNRLRRAALDVLDIKVEPPLEIVKVAGGLMIRLVWRPRFWIKISGGTQPYSWVEQMPQSGGAWSPGTRSGTTSLDPAYEQNANAQVPVGIVVLARRAWGTGAVTFQLAPCSANQPAPGVTPGSTKPVALSVMPMPIWMMTPPPASFSGFPGGRPPLSTVIIPP